MWLRSSFYGVVLFFVATGLVRGGVWFAYVRPTIPKGNAGEIQFETRVDQPSKGEKREYEIGVFFVPENRSNPDSRVIAIDYVRYPAKEKKGPPIFVLPGGPGESHIGKTPNAWKIPYLENARAFSDVVLVNQRGYNPRLATKSTCCQNRDRSQLGP